MDALLVGLVCLMVIGAALLLPVLLLVVIDLGADLRDVRARITMLNRRVASLEQANVDIRAEMNQKGAWG